MTLGIGALGTLLAASGLYTLAVCVVARRFRRLSRHEALPEITQSLGVSILIPLEGTEPTLFENLSAYCELDYRGPVQLVVGSLDADDQALTTVRHVAKRHPGADLHLVEGATILGPNRKASLLAALSGHARHPIIAAIDSDVRVTRDYLLRMLPVLLRPGVGLVSCLYRAPAPNTLARAYEALCINADFCPSVILASVLGRPDIALGASIVLRRETLDQVGGFAALVEHLADDHRLGALVHARGQRVVLAPYVVESDPNPANLAAAFRHQMRWARTLRACAPWGYIGSIVTHTTSVALCTLILASFLPGALVLLALAVLVLRFVAAVVGARALGARVGWTLPLLPFRDLAGTAIWCASFAGNRIEWRGRSYRIGSEGRLRDTAHLAPPTTVSTVRERLLSVVVPAHDEALNLDRLVEEVRRTLDAADLPWEIVIVDDGSVDETPQVLPRLAADDSRVRWLRLPTRSGQTAALVAGFRTASGSLIATLDADLQCPPRELPTLLAALGDADLACGVRIGRQDPWQRRLVSAVTNLMRRCILAPRLRDLACPLRVFRVDALGRVEAMTPLFDGFHRWLPALFVLAQLRVVQRPVTHEPRLAGVSKYTATGRAGPIAREAMHMLEIILRRRRGFRIVANAARLSLP
ncbi:MAG: bacteriohopanetetrol glucosamine biosynthesis glycosyltransferase HpnI [Deltaproteobacteria bacterium]|nr:bacteriohopanetetrol glucosamine biosynthesis glycosyltransferase HpnI [Deltaproteobacteria bacterium]